MEFFDTVKGRRSIRAFMDKPVEKDKVRRVLEAANSAPSAQNLQKYEIFLMEDRHKIAELESVARQEFVSKAPAVLVFCARVEKNKVAASKKLLSEEFPVLDATIAASYAQLAVTALGLGSVWVESFDSDKLMEALGSPDGLIPVVVMPIGYPAEDPEPKPRRKLDDIVHRV
jgi:nitroreductase